MRQRHWGLLRSRDGQLLHTALFSWLPPLVAALQLLIHPWLLPSCCAVQPTWSLVTWGCRTRVPT